MKKVILVLMLVTGLFADGFIIGADVSRSKVSSDIKVSAFGVSESINTNTYSNAFTMRAGYQADIIRVYGYVSTEKYNEDVVVYDEGNIVVIGVGADIMFDKVFVGATLGSGTKDFDAVDIDFTEFGLRTGVSFGLSDGLNAEAGLQYKYRTYDSYTEAPVTIGLDEKLIGVFIGLNFNL